MDVLFQLGPLQVEAKFNQSSAAEIIHAALPLDSTVNCWGDEIYFEIPVKCPPEDETLDLKVGDIGYWPEGACLCLFFGKTPVSVDDRPRPASEVNLVGTFSTPPDALRKVTSGTRVQVVR